MMRALLRKELAQHALAICLLGLLLTAATGLVILRDRFSGEAGSIFMGVLTIYWFVLPLALYLLTQRLIALEFQGKTQLFIEALPVPRWLFLGLKYVLGLAISLALALGILALAAVFGRDAEILTPRFVAILAVRAALWTATVYGLFFFTSFLGRYRLFVVLILGVLYSFAEHATEIHLDRFGPFALVDTRFPYESAEFPVRHLVVSALCAAGLAGLGFALGLVREGSIAGLLGEKMSHRERFAVGGLIMAGFLGWFIFDARKVRAPYDLPGATEESRGQAVIKVSLPAGTPPERAMALGARTADELAAVADYLGFSNVPPVFLVIRTDFTAQQYERVEVKETHDIIIRVNPLAEGFESRHFLDWLLREVLLARTHDRLKREPTRWVLDAFPLYWNDRAQATEALASNARLAPLAAKASRSGLTARSLARWLTLEKAAGADEARALGWSGLRVLAMTHGPEKTRAFLRAVLTPIPPHDARATWNDWRHPVSQKLADATGQPYAEFVAVWQAALAALPRPPGEAARTPHP